VFSRSDILGKQGHFLLDWTVDGRVYRFATADLDVTDKAGTTYHYRKGLRRPEVTPMALGGADASIGVQVQTGDDWADLASKDVQLDWQPAILRRWFVGQTLENARISLRGVSQGSTYGAALDPLEFSIQRLVRRRSWSYPSPQMKVDANTWSDTAGTGTYTRDPKVEGMPYPIVVGYPGENGTATPSASVPAYLVQESDNGADTADTLLVMGHRGSATTIEVWNYSDDPPTSNTETIVYAADDLGRTTGTVTSWGGTAPVKGAQFYTGHSAATGGGIPDPRTGNVLRGAGSLIRHWYETFSDVVVDSAMMDLQAEALDAIKIDTWFNQPVNQIEWLESNIIKLLPVSAREGERGLFYQVWNWEATSADAIAHLNADKGHVRRVSLIQPAGFDVYNSFSMQYRLDRVTGGYRALATVTGDAAFVDRSIEQTASNTDSRVYGSYLCAISQQASAFGLRRAPPISTGVIWDQASAVQILMWQAAQRALPKRVVRYEAPTSYEWLPLGAVVVLTDDEVSLTSRLALLTDYTYGGESMLMELTLLDHPVTHSRAT